MRRSELIQRGRAFLAREDFAGRCTSVVLLTGLVYAVERLLPLVALFDHGWAVWWPTNGITLALLLISRRRHWPFILLGVSVGTAFGQPLGSGSRLEALSIATCNVTEVLVPAFMLPRFYGLTGWLQQPRLVWRFVLSAVLAGPLLSSLLIACYYSLAKHMAFWPIALRWGVPDVLGIIMCALLVLVLISSEFYDLFRWKQLPETLGLLALLAIGSWLVFIIIPHPISFIISPLLLLVATRLGFSGSVIAINLLAPIASYATLHGLGPFSLAGGGNETHRVLMVQAFLILSFLMVFPISVARVQQESTASQLKHSYLQMEALATADGLTGLANRRRFDAALEAEWRRGLRDAQPVAVLILDADNFKLYNDRYGHPAGDLCLQTIAKAICNIPQRGGDLVARYGGEEFVILLPGIDAEGAHTVAEQVRYNVRSLDMPHADNVTGRVTISVGCASMMPTEGADSAALLEGSDRALYMAKKSGRNQSYVLRSEQDQGQDMLYKQNLGMRAMAET